VQEGEGALARQETARSYQGQVAVVQGVLELGPRARQQEESAWQGYQQESAPDRLEHLGWWAVGSRGMAPARQEEAEYW